MGLYKNNGAVSSVGIYFLLIWSLYTIGLSQALSSPRYCARLDLLMGNYKYTPQIKFLLAFSFAKFEN